jgi:hypothetical protein
MTAHLDRSGQLCSLVFGLLSPELEHLAQVLSSQRSATRLWRATDRSVDKIPPCMRGRRLVQPPAHTNPQRHSHQTTHARTQYHTRP